MKTKKIKLNDLQVNSFITEINSESKFIGGAEPNPTPPAHILTYNCSLYSCGDISIPADQCATTDTACPTLHVKCGSNPVTSCFTIPV